MENVLKEKLNQYLDEMKIRFKRDNIDMKHYNFLREAFLAVQPQINTYKISDKNEEYQFSTVSWCTDVAKNGVTGVFSFKKEKTVLILDELYSLNQDKTGAFCMVLTRMLQINGRKFVFVDETYYEWDREVVYEIDPQSGKWKQYDHAVGAGL